MSIDKRIFWPFDKALVSEWPGTRPPGWAYHVGTDFAVPQGTPVRATVTGTAHIWWNDGLGAYVFDIIRPDGLVARHGHLSEMYGETGDWIPAGQVIGKSGGAKDTPGAGLSTGPHLHWELRNSQAWTGPGWYDPRNLLVSDFSALNGSTAKPTYNYLEEKLRKNVMIFFYKHALGKGKPGWLVIGATPNALVVQTQASANLWAKRFGVSAHTTNYGGFKTYLAAAGGSAAQLRAVYREPGK